MLAFTVILCVECLHTVVQLDSDEPVRNSYHSIIRDTGQRGSKAATAPRIKLNVDPTVGSAVSDTPVGSTEDASVDAPVDSAESPVDAPVNSAVNVPVNSAGTAVVAPVSSAGTAVAAPVSSTGTAVVAPVSSPGTAVVAPVSSTGTAVVAPVSSAGTAVVAPVSSDGTAVIAPVSSTGTAVAAPVSSPGTAVAAPVSSAATPVVSAAPVNSAGARVNSAGPIANVPAKPAGTVSAALTNSVDPNADLYVKGHPCNAKYQDSDGHPVAQHSETSNEEGNCECPVGYVCAMDSTKKLLEKLQSEIQVQDPSIQDGVQDVQSKTRPEVGCPALAPDKMEWFTSYRLFTHQTQDVICIELQEGQQTFDIVDVYFLGDQELFSPPMRGNGFLNSAPVPDQ